MNKQRTVKTSMPMDEVTPIDDDSPVKTDGDGSTLEVALLMIVGGNVKIIELGYKVEVIVWIGTVGFAIVESGYMVEVIVSTGSVVGLVNPRYVELRYMVEVTVSTVSTGSLVGA
jgi:hypothetical protein